MSDDDTKKSELAVEREVLLAIGRHSDVLTRKNVVGVGYKGELLFALQSALRTFGPAAVAAAVAATQRHRLTYGLGVGSPDLVLSIGGRAAGFELKRPVGGVVSQEQTQWHEAARRKGMFVCVVRSAVEALAAIDRARRGDVE